MADVALSKIIHGNADGSETVIEYGQPVVGIPKDAVAILKKSGAIGPEPIAASDAMDEIESLRAQLLEAQAMLAAQAENNKAANTPAK